MGLPPAVGVNSPGPRIPPALNRLVIPLAGDSVLAKALVGTYAGMGTITSWRVVDNEGREYLEITLGW